MGAFKIEIVGVGGHGCERKAKEGEKLHGRCGKFNCPDCLAYDFVQRLRQAGMVREGDTAYGNSLALDSLDAPAGSEEYFTDMDHRLIDNDEAHARIARGELVRRFFRYMQKAEFTHWPYSPDSVVDDMLRNERRSGHF